MTAPQIRTNAAFPFLKTVGIYQYVIHKTFGVRSFSQCPIHQSLNVDWQLHKAKGIANISNRPRGV